MMIVYGRNNCQWCDAAKLLLERKGYPYLFKNIETNTNDMEAFKRDFPDAKTVPQILYEYNRIGTYKDLEAWLSTQKS